MRRVLRSSALVLALAASGCASFHSTTQGVLAGGLFGAGAGVAATAIAGGSLATGGAVGAIVGAAAGGYIGCVDSGKCK